MGQTILIADNDQETGKSVERHLNEEAFDIVFADTGRLVKQEVTRRNPLLVILGTSFSDLPGLELARWVLARPNRPGLILLGPNADPIDRTIGLELGADDYMTKPFFARELLARIHSVLRRIQRAGPGEDGEDDAAVPVKAEPIWVSGYCINLLSRQITLPNEVMVTLSWSETKVLSVLLDRRGMPVTRDFLSKKALGRPWNPDERALDQHVAALRRKLHSPLPAAPLIITVRHVGYMIEAAA